MVVIRTRPNLWLASLGPHSYANGQASGASSSLVSGREAPAQLTRGFSSTVRVYKVHKKKTIVTSKDLEKETNFQIFRSKTNRIYFVNVQNLIHPQQVCLFFSFLRDIQIGHGWQKIKKFHIYILLRVCKLYTSLYLCACVRAAGLPPPSKKKSAALSLTGIAPVRSLWDSR